MLQVRHAPVSWLFMPLYYWGIAICESRNTDACHYSTEASAPCINMFQVGRY